MDKAAIIVLADTETHGELGRLVNALSTADEFREHGDEVTIIFDGAGVRWAAELSNATNTQAVAFNYGLYLGSRYKNRPNIIWIAGGDYSVPAGSELETREHKILEGIKAAGSTQLFTGLWNSDHVSTDQAAFAADMDLDSAYEYTVTYPDALAAYQHTPPRPALLFETGYEAEGWSPGDPTSVRAYEYDGELSAIGGTVYGHRDIWAFTSATWSAGYPFGSQRWQLSLGAPGAQDMTRMRALFDAVAWWNLVPAGTAGMRRLVTAGGGTNGTADYATAAAAPDGSTLVAYVPSTSAATRTVTVDLSVMSGPVRSRWYNPTSGAYVVISASSPNTAGSLFTTPGDNGTGARDWVLVIDRV